jgi:hypothetical protein
LELQLSIFHFAVGQELMQEGGRHIQTDKAVELEDQSVCSRFLLGRAHRHVLLLQQKYQLHRRSVLDRLRILTQLRKGSRRWLLAGHASQVYNSGLPK